MRHECLKRGLLFRGIIEGTLQGFLDLMRRLLVILAALLFIGDTMSMHDHQLREVPVAPETGFYEAITPIDLGMITLHSTHPPCQTHHRHSSSASSWCCHHGVIIGRSQNWNGPEGNLISMHFYAMDRKTNAPIMELPTPPPRFS